RGAKGMSGDPDAMIFDEPPADLNALLNMEVDAQRFERPKVVRKQRGPLLSAGQKKAIRKGLPVLIPILMMALVVYLVPWTQLIGRAWPGFNQKSPPNNAAPATPA